MHAFATFRATRAAAAAVHGRHVRIATVTKGEVAQNARKYVVDRKRHSQ